MSKIELPLPLIEAVKGSRVIPFLGAGASKEATDSHGARPPNADQLRDALAQQFFGKPIPNRDLMTVAEMAIRNGAGQSLVFEEVRKILAPFEPGDAHRALADFNWRMIATTNYDLLIEHAYADVKAPRQNPVRFVKDDEPVEARLQETERPVAYLKLHGCLDYIHDRDIPPILTKESYSRYKANRTRLFGRVADYAHESTLIFVGYRLDDPHLRNLIYDIGIDKRPRWFMVTPDAEDYDIDYWSTQNVGIIKCRFGEFMQALSDEIPPLFRQLAHSAQTADLPVRKHFQTNEPESENLRRAFAKDLRYIHANISSEEQSPEQFFQGYDTGWGGILNRYDVRRKVEDDLLFKALLENEKPTGPKLIMLRGAAGAGKTIALKRTAFEAATASGAITLWLVEGGALHFDVLAELYELTRQPIYMFVDQIGFRVPQVLSFLKSARARSLPVIVIGAERDADWNSYCGALEAEFPPEFLRVGNLSMAEVEGLLDLLERHGCLGLLGKLSRDDQVKAFMDKNRADRQLLVALHELTLGKPFEKIVLEEHQRIFPDQAQQLYLDIATMHQFSVNVRAGIISRISGIAFEDFQSQFLEPLRSIVRVDRDPYSGDLCYKTRHPRVAAIVFRETCPDDESKATQLKRIVENLDVGYSVDKRALEEICRGRTLAETFASIEQAREVYQAAITAAPKQAFLYQQWALLEAHHREGSLTEAYRLAGEAHDLEPRNKTITHTLAEIDRKRANVEESELLKDSLRRRAREWLNDMPANDRFATSSRCKLLVDEVVDLAAKADATGSPHDAVAYAEKVKAAEGAILRAQQSFPEDADIDQVEARFRDEVDEEDKALRALEQALAAGARGSGTAIRVARMYDARGRSPDALKVLQAALGRSPDDRAAHHAMAIHLMHAETPDLGVIEDHLRRSFSRGDRNYENRFDLAQLLFFSGQIPACEVMFAEIDHGAPEDFRRSTPRTENVFTRRLNRYSGRITSIKPGYAFLRSSAYLIDIFGHRSMSDADTFDDLMIGDEINFRIRFNRQGPTAVDMRLGRAA
ncbi:SIR2 family NAD-dependent protein deacylase [Novosphingopyxis iocasae]|uniref:SIR2 family NAD-dependent protein deacylase n=1 Tax=Novosphingopyxis iocasae TaxID=2762729 RepID=UPI00165133A3|nr:SIR2 family protein [Novosphingopyxis iocasae]